MISFSTIPSFWHLRKLLFFSLVSDKAGTRIQIFLYFLPSQKNHRDNRGRISDTLKALAPATFVLDYGEYVGFPGGSDGKASASNIGDPGSIPGLGRCPGEENGNPLQYPCLENPMDRGAW